MRRPALAPLLALAACTTIEPRPAPAPQPPAPLTAISEPEVRAMVAILASDGFEGRMSGTAGEKKTVDYLAERLRAAGVAGGMADGGYRMPFAIAPQNKPVPPPVAGVPRGQIAFLKAVNAMGAAVSHNVVGKVAGARPDGKAVVVMAHWDHLGLCRPAGEADRLCNGAVDNASGTAAVLALAARVARMNLDRDVWFVFTGAEEWGLLGAKAFAARPPLPLDSIVAGFNLDMVGVASGTQPVAMVAAKGSPLAPLVREATAAVGRQWDGDEEASVFVERQDGWALASKGVPMVMAGGSFSDMKRLQAFLAATYHGEDDELTARTDLSGAVADANLHVELVRRAASRGFNPAAR